MPEQHHVVGGHGDGVYEDGMDVHSSFPRINDDGTDQEDVEEIKPLPDDGKEKQTLKYWSQLQ